MCHSSQSLVYRCFLPFLRVWVAYGKAVSQTRNKRCYAVDEVSLTRCMLIGLWCLAVQWLVIWHYMLLCTPRAALTSLFTAARTHPSTVTALTTILNMAHLYIYIYIDIVIEPYYIYQYYTKQGDLETAVHRSIIDGELSWCHVNESIEQSCRDGGRTYTSWASLQSEQCCRVSTWLGLFR